MRLSQDIEPLIREFVDQLTAVVRKEALRAVGEVLGNEAAVATPTRRASRSAAPVVEEPAPAPRASRASAKNRAKGQKRSPEELEKLESSLLQFVIDNPGHGIEAIGRALGYPTSELTRPMKKLVMRNSIRAIGEKRATKYHAADGASASSGSSGSEDGGAIARGRVIRRPAKKGRGRKR